MAALAAHRSVDPPAEHVELVTAHLSRTLQEPCAETHLHVGAAVPFGVLWTALMRGLADDRNHAETLKKLRESFGDVLPFQDADRFLHLLRSAALARVAMAAFVRYRERGGTERYAPFIASWMYFLTAQIVWPWGSADAIASLRAMLRLLYAPDSRIVTSHVLAQALLRAAFGPMPRDRRDPHHDVIAADPLSAWLTHLDHPALPETRFNTRALSYLGRTGSSDVAFATMFWQYHRIRGATFRALTQEPGTAGLHWFTRFYNRIGLFRKLLPRYRGQEPSWYHALRTESRDLKLGALEARTSPEESVEENRELLRGIARQAMLHRPEANAARPEIGLVLHFIKEDTYKSTGVRRLHADPGGIGFGARHAAWYHGQRRRAVALSRMLRDYPELLLVLRGIDVANLEQAQPAWVLRPLFDIVREASVHASRRLAFMAPSWRVPPVRATLHAGEDYLRIVEGIRRMHEAIEFGLLRQGDRFGHGLAVGANPEGERGTSVVQPREERLDDLLWEIDRYEHGDFTAPAARIERARHDACKLACDIYRSTDSVTLKALLDARRLRHNPAALTRLRYPHVERLLAHRGQFAWTLFVEHLTDSDVFTRGRVPVVVESTEDERAMLVAAQRWLRCEIARREITIESNPSSNLLIGDLHQMSEHPAMRLQPAGADMGHGESVHLSVNTDNPITFGSCLGDEFAFIYAALLRQKVAAREALAWINERREDGWRSRFTLEASADPENLARLLPEARHRGPLGSAAARRGR